MLLKLNIILQEIPRFLPILRGVLSSQRNPPETLKKIEPKYIFRFLLRIQQHFNACREVVSTEQTTVTTKIVEVF